MATQQTSMNPLVLKYLSKRIRPSPTHSCHLADQNYLLARQSCLQKVESIINHCRSHNTRYRDESFNISKDPDCHSSLLQPTIKVCTKRVPFIFDHPEFIKDGFDNFDVMQGGLGDCWYLAALSLLTLKPNLLHNVCVARDEQVGVYGFVFFRDGGWITTIIDDTLLVENGVLSMAKCRDENETWLPLLEKAYAKAHGDFSSIDGGITGEALEDMTGGVFFEYQVDEIMDHERFWNEELANCKGDRLFSCGIDHFESTLGLIHHHSYAIIKAVQVVNRRFLLIKNPHGKSEWTGRWSDGSSEWTPEWMTLLNHKFGDDGAFWMEYCDFMDHWTTLDKVLLFDASWSLVRSFMNVTPRFPSQFGCCLFQFTIEKDTEVVISLSKADERYFKGLGGQIAHSLQFKLYQKELITQSEISADRSVSLHLSSLKEGTYYIVPRLISNKIAGEHPVSLIEKHIDQRMSKVENLLKKRLESYQKASNAMDIPLVDVAYHLSSLRHSLMGSQMLHEEMEDLDEEQAKMVLGACLSTVTLGLRIYSRDPEMKVEAFQENERRIEILPNETLIFK